MIFYSSATGNCRYAAQRLGEAGIEAAYISAPLMVDNWLPNSGEQGLPGAWPIKRARPRP